MPLKHNFDEVVDRRGTDSAKWLEYPADVLPMWVADSDFKCPQPVVEAMRKVADHGVYGYPHVPEGGFEKATVRWCRVRHNWKIDASMVEYVPSLGTALAVAVKAFCRPGDKVLMQTPIYPPFNMATERNGAEPLHNSLSFVDGKWVIDWEDFERKAADPRCRLFLLCNPHNPTGRVFTRDELLEMADICAASGVVVFADEVHADFVYPGHTHVVFPTVSEKAKRISLVGLNPSKTFNTAGTRTASVVTMNPDLQRVYGKALGACKLGRNSFGTVAYIKAFTECDYYADQVRDYVYGNLRYAVDYIGKNVPQIKAYMPGATYLLWLDCRGLPFATQEELDRFFVEKVKVGLNPGNTFGPEGERFLRMNLACPRSYVEEAMRRITAAVDALQTSLQPL